MHTNAAIAAGLKAAEEGPGVKVPIIPAWGELIFGIVAFLVLLFLIQRFVVPRLEQAYAERTAAIEGGMEQAGEAQRQAEAAKQQYEDQLRGAQDEAAKIREDARSQGAQIVADSREQANAEAQRIIDNAHKQIAAERQQAAVSLRSDVGRLSTDLASKIVGESLHDDVRQRGIVERFLGELEAGKVTPTKVGSTSGEAGA
ncbi:F0F1 ATP synthase subunit B [Calidifontibacter sp. DB0510]|uniref:ATP synthase subunit b n=1 Tax=Metallococcus carri TaxID=1656884 RepID=A0A967EHH5_9MICO|nr:F0F1 ATP synthase subunit B [Metallococcus carri]NHN56373.1 F0F1 ATP synthase subunit B [Metallococcus carri]NOP35997.1 F0F1 ATP synthase subunit B [Calidifontibacter sp. DB2511S]